MAKGEIAMFSEPIRMSGYLVQSFFICRRQTWLLSRAVMQDQDNEYLSFGRLVDRDSYSRDRHQLSFGDDKLDFIRSDDDGLVVCEVKKSSRAEASARMQLAHYLYDLRKAGIEAKGLLMFPTEKKREEVRLTPEIMAELDDIYAKIEELTERSAPPPAKMGKYCKKCAYAEHCWS